MSDELNVILSSDDNYACHLGVAVYSLLEHNRDFEKVRVFVVSNGISADNATKLQEVVGAFANGVLEFIDFAKWRGQLKLNLAWKISISSYARLFVASMLPTDAHRILYMDCDMIVCDSLRRLWNSNLGGAVLGAVQDTMPLRFKEPVGVGATETYFNAGLLLIDMDKWRSEEMERKCLDFINEKGGRVIHHDQGVLNGLLKGQWCRLPLADNLMTIHYVFNMEKIRKYFKDEAEFYAEEEIAQAKERPVILHYTPSFTTRPWVKGCAHPLKKLYWETLAKTPWAGAKPIADTRKWYLKIIEWRYRVLPF